MEHLAGQSHSPSYVVVTSLTYQPSLNVRRIAPRDRVDGHLLPAEYLELPDKPDKLVDHRLVSYRRAKGRGDGFTQYRI